MELRYKTVADEFHFLRSFVPYYYQLVKTQPGLTLSLAPLAKFNGWCVGDAHLENFGAVLQPSGNAIFTINDMDDAGPCPLSADALRFFTGVYLWRPDADVGEAVDAYLAGLKNGRGDLSKPVSDLIQNAEDGGQKVPKKFRGETDLRLARQDGYSPVPPADLEDLTEVLEKTFGPRVKVYDALLEDMRWNGGSGGLRRYVALVSSAEVSQPGVIEIKEVREPGIFPLAAGKIPSPATRFQRTLEMEQGSKVLNWYGSVGLKGASYIVRPKIDGNVGVSIDDFKEDELEKIVLDEARTLGALHSDSHEDYVSAARALPKDAWLKAAQAAAVAIRSAYAELKVGR